MKPKLIQKFKKMFEDQKADLAKRQKILNDEFVISQDDILDESDRTSTELEQSMRLRLRNREALYMKKIDQALERISKNTFGTCESCEEDIEVARMEARPITTLCLKCKESQERVEQIHIGSMRRKSIGQKIRFA